MRVQSTAALRVDPVCDAVVYHGSCGDGRGECDHLGLSDVSVSIDQATGEPLECRGRRIRVDGPVFYPVRVVRRVPLLPE